MEGGCPEDEVKYCMHCHPILEDLKKTEFKVFEGVYTFTLIVCTTHSTLAGLCDDPELIRLMKKKPPIAFDERGRVIELEDEEGWRESDFYCPWCGNKGGRWGLYENSEIHMLKRYQMNCGRDFVVYHFKRQ